MLRHFLFGCLALQAGVVAAGQVQTYCLPVVAVARCTDANGELLPTCDSELAQDLGDNALIIATAPSASSFAAKQTVKVGFTTVDCDLAETGSLVCDVDTDLTGSFRVTVFEHGAFTEPWFDHFQEAVCKAGFPADF